MKYKELDLKEIRDKNNLDFAHYTYEEGQCSCCYGPSDMSEVYWKNEEKKEDNYTFILFKNAENGSGEVCGEDIIDEHTYISHHFESVEQKSSVCKDLQKQLGGKYKVLMPKTDNYCIIIMFSDSAYDQKEFSENYDILEGEI